MRMQKSLLALCLAFAGCGSCSDASSASSPAASTESKPTPKATPAGSSTAARPALPANGTAPDMKSDTDPSDRGKMRDRSVKLDTNGDGVISDEERADAVHRRALQMHARLDKDGDGKVT